MRLWITPILSLTAVLSMASAVTAQTDAMDLRQAIDAGMVKAELRCTGPHTFRMRLRSAQGRRLRLALRAGTFVVPAGEQGSVPRGVNKDTLSGQKLRRTTQKVTDRQPGAIGGFHGRGSFGGRREFYLVPGRIETFDVPFLATALEKFEPSSDVQYKLVRVTDWSKDERIRSLLEEVASDQTCYGVAQAALWNFVHGVELPQVRQYKPDVLNEAELWLAEHLVAEIERWIKEPNAQPAKTPAKLYVKVVNRVNDVDLRAQLTQLAVRMRQLADRTRLLGLPVEYRDLEKVELDSDAEVASAIGCQMTLGHAEGQVHARVLISRWDGKHYRPHREVRVWLGPRPSARQALSQINAELLKHLVKVRPVADEEEAAKGRVELINDFPLALHAVRLHWQLESNQSARSITLSEFAIGPGRSIEVDLKAPAAVLKTMEASWGR